MMRAAMHKGSRLAVSLIIGIAAVTASTEHGFASHDRFVYKLPCHNPSACYVTQLAHVNNALDFDPLGSAGLGTIPAMSEGVVDSVNNQPTSCNGIGLGKTVVVKDLNGRMTTYAHLSSIAVQQGTAVLQGDALGVEGNTGNSYQCAPHLHWEPGGSLPGYIDDVLVSSLTANPTNYGSSNTNSVVGEYSTPGASLRAYYAGHGGWSTIGWTHAHCPGTCTLHMTNNRAWGRMQDFRHHVDPLGGQFNTIHVADWHQTQAYLVDSMFWQTWAAGALQNSGNVHPISMARQDRGSCPSGSTPVCASYQRFHLGYVWMNALTGRAAEFCPDLSGATRGVPNGVVSFIDVNFVLDWAGNSTNHYPDTSGEGVVSLLDVNEVLGEVGKHCKPV
jgi:hypothetical protein